MIWLGARHSAAGAGDCRDPGRNDSGVASRAAAAPAATAEPAPETKPQEVEKPATDAPREGKSDRDDEHVAEKEKPAAAPPPPPAPTPSTEPSPPAEAAAPELPKAPEPDAPEPVKTETPKPAAPPKPSVMAALPKTFEDVPDVEFGGAAIRSPVTGGNAKSTYLSQLYGMIVHACMCRPWRTPTGARWWAPSASRSTDAGG